MANTSAICNSFKQEVLVATHNFTASTGNTFKLALFDSSATLGAGTTAYATSEEITGTGYTAGGKTLTSVTPVLDSSIVNDIYSLNSGDILKSKPNSFSFSTVIILQRNHGASVAGLILK